MTAFGSDGFSLGAMNDVNYSSATFVAWAWKETADAGFDIVTATGNATNKTISHSLSAVPHVIFSKEKTGSANDWVVYHHKNTSAPETDYLILNTNAATADNPQFNDTAPTSSVFSVGTATSVNGGSLGGHSMIAYLWSEKQGFSKFGSYTGNGNADGPMLHMGFSPAWILCKKSSASGDSWTILDNKRDTYNVADARLFADQSAAESTSTDVGDFLSNGFKIRTTAGTWNDSGGTYIYAAFAHSPFVNSNGVPATAR